MLASPALLRSEAHFTEASTSEDDMPAVIVAGIVSQRPGEIALRQGETSTSYAALWSRAQQFAGGLAACGLRRGDRLGIALSDGPDRLACELAAAILGAIWCRADTDSPARTLRFRVAAEDRWADLTPDRLSEADDHVARPPCPPGLSPVSPACVLGSVTLSHAELTMQLRAEANDLAFLRQDATTDHGLDPGWRAIIAGETLVYPAPDPEPSRPSLSQRLWSLIG